MSGRILSDAQIDEMVELREKGWGNDRIAAHFTAAGTPISASAINWQCMRAGADAPPRFRGSIPSGLKAYVRHGHPVRPFSPGDDEMLRRLDMEGARISEMARQLGRRENSIRGRLLTIARHDARREDAA